MRKQVALIGLGNILLRDEGVGVRAVEALRDEFDFSNDLSLIDGGTLGLDLLPFLEGKEKVLFLDALDLKKKPGTIAILEDEEIPSIFGPALSFHQIGLADLLLTSQLIGTKPARIALIGIQPEKVEPGLGLTPTIQENLKEYIQAALGKLREWGIESRNKGFEKPTEARVPGYEFRV
jgi:hydrogenase maturation protease